jgi:transposase InsO family protein
MCKVSKSSYYYYQTRKDYKFNKDKEDVELVTNIFNSKKQKAGIRTIHMILLNKHGVNMSLKKIARIKKEYGLVTKIRKKTPYNMAFKKGLEHRTSPNILKQDFAVGLPDYVYSTDISYLLYKGGKRAYLSATKDLCSKEIVGFNVSANAGMETAWNGLETLLKCKNTNHLIIHSDQGSHYTHPIYVNLLKDFGVTQSMSRKGNCLDNAPIESFFGHMKDEINLKDCESFEEVKELVANYIDYYNNERYQWGLNKMTPVQYRRHLLNQSP